MYKYNMCSISSKRAALVLCIVLNAISLNTGEENTWTALSAEMVNKPNNDAEYPHFSPFRDTESFQVGDETAVLGAKAEEPLLSSKTKLTQPLNNFVAGLYHNYRSSYIGNKTTLNTPNRNHVAAVEEVDNKIDAIDVQEEASLRKRKRKPLDDYDSEIKYNVGPGVNISVEMDKELVSVYLDEDCLKDVFTGKFARIQDTPKPRLSFKRIFLLYLI